MLFTVVILLVFFVESIDENESQMSENDNQKKKIYVEILYVGKSARKFFRNRLSWLCQN